MAHVYTYSCIDMILYIYNINETVVFPRLIWPFFCSHFFWPTIHQELFHYLQVGLFISVDISKVYVMLSPTSQSYPEFHSFFNKEKTSAETATKLDIISSIWDDDHIRRVDEKTGNAYGVIKLFKESMLLRLLLTYWGIRVCILNLLCC